VYRFSSPRRPLRLTLAAAAGTAAAYVTAITRWRPSRLTLVAAAVTIAAAVAAITRHRPPRPTLVAAAATMATAVTALAVVATSGSPAPSADSSSNATIHESAASAAGQAGALAPHAVSGAQPAAQQPASQQPAARQPAPAAHPATAAPVQPATPAQPYLIYDSVEPETIPSGPMIATYATGNDPTAPADVAGRQVMWIDVTGTDYGASALDVEPGNVGPAQAAVWALNRLTLYPDAIAHIYTFLDEWPAVQAAVAATVPPSMQSRIRWWIADPTGVPHMVPGAQATQWYWGPTYDISTAMPGF
jgi:hypothetical protein